MAFCQKCGTDVGDMNFCGKCGAKVQLDNVTATGESATMPTTQACPRCAAGLTEGYCEYCGWNSPKAIPDKTLKLTGLLCSLVVTRDACTFTPKVGSPAVIANSEISRISLSQASAIGTGELSIQAVTGITQKITFLFPQNSAMGNIASYLLHVAPGAQFANHESDSNVPDISGIKCPKCESNDTSVTGESRKKSTWKIVVGALIAISGIGGMGETGILTGLIIIILGIALAASGLGIVGKIRTACLCKNCRKRFWV